MEAINIYPELIKWKPNKQGLVPVAIRFDFNNQRAAYEQINHRIHPDQWDFTKKKVKPSSPLAQLLNQHIDNRLNKHKNYFLKRETFHLPISKELIKTYVRSGSTLESFYEYAEKVINTKTLKDGLTYNNETKRSYNMEVKKLMKFKPELSFCQVTLKFLNEYKLWLQNVYRTKSNKQLDKNSIWKAFKFMRMVYNDAISNDIIMPDDNPFKKFEVGHYEIDTTKIKYLELSEVEAIEKILINDELKLQELTIKIGWRFLAMCVSGLRISDAMRLEDSIFNDVGDLEIIPHKTKRHGNKAHIPIVSDRQRRYMEKTLSLPLPLTDSTSFRTTFNIHLKILCAKAGISSFTSHAGRHTMGSLLVDAGIQDKAAMAMLGVKTDQVIKTYMHLKNSKLQSEAMKLKNVM